MVGNVPECIAAYQAALATNPGNSEARFHLGRALEVQVRLQDRLCLLLFSNYVACCPLLLLALTNKYGY